MVAFSPSSSVPVSGQHRTELPLQMNLLPWGTFRLLRWGVLPPSSSSKVGGREVGGSSLCPHLQQGH